jgi:hypothetical protein
MSGAWANNIRVAIPGIIDSFDATTQTVTVQPAIREKIQNEDGSQEWVNLPLLVDVPIVLPRAGNFVLTMPITKGDECLVMFADLCIDAWFSNGGIQNQIEKRRHDLSDSFAILGCWSQPEKLPYYSTDTTQLRNLAGTSYIEVTDTGINLVGAAIRINGHVYNNHTHSAPSGGGTTSGVL